MEAPPSPAGSPIPSEIDRIELIGNSAVLHSKNHILSIQPPLYS